MIYTKIPVNYVSAWLAKEGLCPQFHPSLNFQEHQESGDFRIIMEMNPSEDIVYVLRISS